MVRNAIFAYEAATIIGDEQIVLNTDTTEVLIGLQLVEVDELLAVAAGFPVIDQCGNEVDTRLVGDDKAFLQTAP